MFDKNVPIPKVAAPTNKKYFFADMEVGDSIFLEGMDSHSSPCVSARQIGKRSGKKFTSRSVTGGVRIWRTE